VSVSGPPDFRPAARSEGGEAIVKRVLVIGLDGLEPGIVEGLLAEGALPHLARLSEQAGLARVATTAPAQTPVAWSTFATGVNPGAHGIFDFLRRDPRTYRLDNGLNRYERRNAFVPPRAVNLRRGRPLWDRLSEAGIPSVVLRCPCAYPPDPVRGSLLSGMGVPDLRGGFGTSTFYHTGPAQPARESENIVPIVEDRAGTAATYLIGPRHPRTRADVRLEIALNVDRPARRLTVRSAGTPRELVVELGRWSDWLKVRFKLGPLQTAAGIVRFLLVRLEPNLELYASPVNFDPDAPLFPISSPPEYARELESRIGTYYTAGMVEDHNGLSNERFDEGAFLAQCEDAWRERRAMLAYELDRFREGFLYCLFDTPDRVQHMLWRFREPDHPANRGAAPDPAYRHAIEDCYRTADEVVGQALEAVDDRTLLIVLSDHGFGSFRRGFHLNKWLHDEGLLALKPGHGPGPDAGEFLQGIDWDRTRAYALGLNGLYLNLQGREAKGIVRPDEAGDLKARIARALGGLRDPQRGEVAVLRAQAREDVYRGPFVDEAPDVIVHHAPGYRVSWSTSLGGVAAGPPFEDNTRRWSGDHIIDPDRVPGVLLMNRPFRGATARLADLAPTILEALGLVPPADSEGGSLLS
jgi:predicted AlkP superfamily phosphohydrolase/phosphomutase